MKSFRVRILVVIVLVLSICGHSVSISSEGENTTTGYEDNQETTVSEDDEITSPSEADVFANYYNVRYSENSFDSVVTITSTSTTPPSSTTKNDPEITPTVEDNRAKNALKSWELLAKFTPQTLDNALQKLWPQIFEASATSNISLECKEGAIRFIQGVTHLKNWAVRMLDATGKFPSGILEGTLTDFGSYDECISTVAVDEHDAKRELFRGQYCNVLMRPHLDPKLSGINALRRVVDNKESAPSDTVFSSESEPSQYFYLTYFRLGVCTPSVCSIEELQRITENALAQVKWSVNISRCEVKQQTHLDPGQLTVTVLFSVMGFFVLVGTFLDFFLANYHCKRIIRVQQVPRKLQRGFKDKIERILLGFSIFLNLKKLLKTSASSRSLPYIHGIRFLSISWIILANTYGLTNLSSVRRMKNVIEATKDVTFQTIVNGWVAVDSFFFLGGLMVAYSTILRMEDKNEKINVFKFIFHRYWRVTPTLMMAVAALILLPVIGSGPLWYETITPEVEICKRNWWATLLHISNWRNLNNLCYGPSWYLCVDFQLYLMSMILLFILSRRPLLGIIIMLILVTGSSTLVAYLTIVRDFSPSMVPLSPDQDWVMDMMYYIHTKPYTHMGSYCIGIATGYLLRKVQVVKLHAVFQIGGWIIAGSSGFAVLYGAYDWNNGHKPSNLESALYSSCHRIAWALGLAWTVFTCTNGYSNALRTFLSWKPFIPLSRLTFAAYLIHPLVIQFRSGTVKERIYFSHYDMVYLYLGHMGITFALAFLAVISFEYPFKNIEKVVMPNRAGGNFHIDPLGSTTRIVQTDIESTKTCCCEDTTEEASPQAPKKMETTNAPTKEQVSRL